jgi:hypothetical protein
MSPRRKKKKQPIYPLVLVAAGVLLIAGTLAFMAGQGGPQVTPTVFPTAAASNRIPFPEIERVTATESYTAWEAGSAILVDTRGDPYYSMQHIPDAVNLPEQAVPGELAELPRDTRIITYCT